MNSASPDIFSPHLLVLIEMLYATDIPLNKQSEYIRLRLCLRSIIYKSCTSLFVTMKHDFPQKKALLKVLENIL